MDIQKIIATEIKKSDNTIYYVLNKIRIFARNKILNEHIICHLLPIKLLWMD